MATNFCPDLRDPAALEAVKGGIFETTRVWWWPGRNVETPQGATTDPIVSIASKKIAIPNGSTATATSTEIEVGPVPDYGVDSVGQPKKMGLLSSGVLSIDVLNNPIQSDAVLNTMMNDLEARGILPRPLTTDVIRQGNLNGSPSQVDPIQQYVTAVDTFRNNVQSEYCWYYSRYLGAVSLFLESLAQSSSGSTTDPAATQALTMRRDLAKKLNMRVNTIIALMNGIAKRRYTQNQGYDTTINDLNNQIGANANTLLTHYKIFNDNAPQADFQKRLVEYTVEKNRAQENMIALFFTLNVVAIASLFIIARNM